MANNREISQFAGLVTVNDTTNQVSLGSTVSISNGGDFGVGTDTPTFSNGSGLEITRSGTSCIRIEGNNENHAFEIYANSDGGTIDARGSNANMMFDIGGSEKARIDQSGRVLVGATTSFDDDSSFQIRGSYVNSGQRNGMSIQYGEASSGGSSDINLIRDRNNNGGVTSLQDSDVVGTVKFFGLDGTNPVESARIRSVVGGPTGISSMPGELRFYTTPSGSGTPSERARINKEGQLIIGGTSTASTGAVAAVQGAFSYGATNYPAHSKMILSSGSTDMSFTVTFISPGSGIYYPVYIDIAVTRMNNSIPRGASKIIISGYHLNGSLSIDTPTTLGSVQTAVTPSVSTSGMSATITLDTFSSSTHRGIALVTAFGWGGVASIV